MSVEAQVGAGVLTLVSIWVAAMLLSRLSKPLFWCACILIVVCASYLIATDATEDIGRAVGQYVSDQMKATEDMARTAPNPEKMWGSWVVVMPIAVVFGAFVIWHRLWERRIAILVFIVAFNILSVLIFMSSLPEKVARLVFPEEVLKASYPQPRNP